MSDDTTRLKLPQLVQQQAVNEVSWNEALTTLDALIDLTLKGQFVNDPPSAPCDGDAWLIGGTPTGAWSGSPYKIASCLDGGWRIHEPFDGLRAYLEPAHRYISYHGGQWRDDGASGLPLDVFLIAGQSNARGRGDKAQSPVPSGGTALQFYNGTISAAVDPVGDADTGSAWPSFAVTYFNATRRAVAFVPASAGGTAQSAAADTGAGNWDASGALYANSVTALQTALAAFTAAGYAPQLAGILWCQGEGDAIAINTGTIVAATYQAALAAMIARYRSSFGVALPFYIFKTGTDTTVSDTGYAAVRAAQEAVAAADPFTRIVFGNAAGFAARGMSNGVHYTQAGYNEMGRVGAASIVAGFGLTGFQALGNGGVFYDQGQVFIGRGASSGGTTSTLEVVGGSGVAAPGTGFIKSSRYGGNTAFICQRFNGTVSAPTGCLANDLIGGIYAAGATTAGVVGNNVAVITFSGAENFTPTAQGSYMSFHTTALGTVWKREVMRLTDKARLRLLLSAPPASATDTGDGGEIAWDGNYLYVCVAANSWKRAPLASW